MTWIASIRHFGEGAPEGGSVDPPLISDEIDGEGGSTVCLSPDGCILIAGSALTFVGESKTGCPVSVSVCLCVSQIFVSFYTEVMCV